MRAGRTLSAFLVAALATELVDELVDGATGGAWPFMRSDLHLSYAQVGLLLGVPAILANLIEPAFGLLADAGYRRRVVLAGGVAFAAALALTAVAGSFWPLLVAFVLFYPASGAFVSLTQAALMDAAPARREQNMTRWALAGSVGNVLGPLLVACTVTLGLSWRPAFALLAVLAVGALALMWRSRRVLDSPRARPGVQQQNDPRSSVRGAARGTLAALARADVRGTLALLEASNLLLDVFRGFLALYVVDAAGATPAQGALAVVVLTVAGLAGDALVVPLLERVSGVAFVRLSAALAAVVFPAFLLAPHLGVKLALLGVLGPLTAGWYAVLQARLYDLLPERSGAVMVLGSVAGIVGGAVPVMLGLLAQWYGVQAAMWALLLGPVALLLGLPRAPLRRDA